MRIRHTALVLVLAVIVVSLVTPALPATMADPTLTRLSKLSGHAFDIAFMQALVPVKDEVVEMTMTATLYADHPDLLHWNQSFVEREQGQTRHLLAALEEAGAGPSERKVGVATPSVKKLRGLRGAALERAFLPMMASQLDKSVGLARLATQKASRPAVRSLAKEIVTADGQDASRLRGWLKQWYK